MAVLAIKTFPDKVLRQRAEPVDQVTDDIQKLIRDMFETMYFSNGVGLAAPQVGVLKRIIVCNPTGEKADELAIINPRIVYKKGRRMKDCEGCLSIPGMSSEVVRFSKIKVRGKDANGDDLTLEAEDLLARIIDHENDHLDGVLFIDKIGFLARRRLLHKYKKKMGIVCAGRKY